MAASAQSTPMSLRAVLRHRHETVDAVVGRPVQQHALVGETQAEPFEQLQLGEYGFLNGANHSGCTPAR